MPLWHKDLGRFDHIWGNASSPIIYRDLVLLNCGPGLRSFMLALDKNTGQERWRREFPGMASQKLDDFVGSWSSPVIASHDGQDLLLISLPSRLYALDPLNGNEIWSCEGLGKLIYSSPMVSPQAIVAMSGYQGPTLAVKPGGRGDVTATHRLWIHDERPPQRIGTGIIVGDQVYVLNEPGIAWCLDLLTGEILWKHRLSDTSSWSSMCYAAGHIYVNDMHGTTYVLAPSDTEATVLARNPLEERMRLTSIFGRPDFRPHVPAPVLHRGDQVSRPRRRGRVGNAEPLLTFVDPWARVVKRCARKPCGRTNPNLALYFTI